MAFLELKFEVFSYTENQYYSPKVGKIVYRSKLMGRLVSSTGEKMVAQSDLAFNCEPSYRPKTGEVVFVGVVSYNTRGDLVEMTHDIISPIDATSKTKN